MYVLACLTNGFGNKVIAFAVILYVYRIAKRARLALNLYIFVKDSKHGTQNLQDVFSFPSDVHFIDETVYNKLKKTAMSNIRIRTFLPTSNEIISSYYPLDVGSPAFLKYTPRIFEGTNEWPVKLTPSPLFDYEKGLAVHIRYGDKLVLNEKTSSEFLLLKPEWYIRAMCVWHEAHPHSPIYIFTDSPTIVEHAILPSVSFAHLIPPNILTWDATFVAFTRFKHIITSDSTLPLSAIYIRSDCPKVISYGLVSSTFSSTNPIVAKINGYSLSVNTTIASWFYLDMNPNSILLPRTPLSESLLKMMPPHNLQAKKKSIRVSHRRYIYNTRKRN